MYFDKTKNKKKNQNQAAINYKIRLKTFPTSSL